MNEQPDKWAPVVDAIFDNVVNPSDTPETDAEIDARGQYLIGGVVEGSMIEVQYVLAEFARRLERDRDRIRARSQRQRKELRRINAQTKALWKGFTRGVLAEDALNTRCAMAEKFGWDAVREAEHEYLKQRQDEAEKAK